MSDMDARIRVIRDALAGLGVTSLGYAYLSAGKPYLIPIAMLMVCLGILYVFYHRRYFLLPAFAIALLLSATNLLTRPPVLTDEEAIILYASTLFLHHQNPYTANMATAFTLYHVPFNVITGTIGNSLYVTTYIYPPLSFILVSLTHSLLVVDIVFAVITYVYAWWKDAEGLFFSSFFLYSAVAYDLASGMELNLPAYFLAFMALLSSNKYVRYLLLGLSVTIKQFALLIAPLLLRTEQGDIRTRMKYFITFLAPLVIVSIPFASSRYIDMILALTNPVAQQGVSVSLLTSFGVPVPSFVYALTQLALYGILLIVNKKQEYAWGLPALLWIFSYRDLGYYDFYFALFVIQVLRNIE